MVFNQEISVVALLSSTAQSSLRQGLSLCMQHCNDSVLDQTSIAKGEISSLQLIKFLYLGQTYYTCPYGRLLALHKAATATYPNQGQSLTPTTEQPGGCCSEGRRTTYPGCATDSMPPVTLNRRQWAERQHFAFRFHLQMDWWWQNI